MRSSSLLAKIDEPWSIDHKIGVLVDEQSTGSLTDRGALKARLGNVFNDLQVCNSNLIRSL